MNFQIYEKNMFLFEKAFFRKWCASKMMQNCTDKIILSGPFKNISYFNLSTLIIRREHVPRTFCRHHFAVSILPSTLTGAPVPCRARICWTRAMPRFEIFPRHALMIRAMLNIQDACGEATPPPLWSAVLFNEGDAVY